ncbi:hypothetical protein [Streptomyces sp. NPDC051014]|uniref:hypothetical protein n=1 Tax=Streptomyces sp. NPDC051014 TaxID=3155751 RepID=UPI0033FD31A3
MAQVTTATRAYTLWLSEDLPPETFPLLPEVEHTPEMDQLALDYLKAKLALFKAVSPTRAFPDRWLDYEGTTVVSETTTEHNRLFPAPSDTTGL